MRLRQKALLNCGNTLTTIGKERGRLPPPPLPVRTTHPLPPPHKDLQYLKNCCRNRSFSYNVTGPTQADKAVPRGKIVYRHSESRRDVQSSFRPSYCSCSLVRTHTGARFLQFPKRALCFHTPLGGKHRSLCCKQQLVFLSLTHANPG